MHACVRVLIGLAALCALAACGDDTETFDVNRRRQQARPDAGTGGDMLSDGGGATNRDGSTVSPDVDGSAALDGATPDGGSPMDMMQCETAEELTWDVEVTFSDEAGFDLQSGPTGFGLVYMAEVGGVERVHALRIPSSGPIGEAHPIFDMRPNSAKVLDTALIRTGDAWRVAWTDNSVGRVELMALDLDAELMPVSGASAVQVTNTDAPDVETRPVLAQLHGLPFAAWVVEHSRQPVALRLSPLNGPAPVDLVPVGGGRRPARAALSALGPKDNMNGVLAWTEPNEPGAQRGVWLQPLDEAGAAAGDPMRLSEQASVGESVSLASNQTGGAIAYSLSVGGTSREVRFMRLGQTGEPMSGEVSVVGSPLQGTDAAIAALGQGYVIAYRALPGGSITEAGIRIVFLTKEGILSVDGTGSVISLPVAVAGEASARLAVKVSNEGQILVAWLDQVAGKKLLHLARHRLDCW